MALITTTEMFKKTLEADYAIGTFNVNNMEIIQDIVDATRYMLYITCDFITNRGEFFGNESDSNHRKHRPCVSHHRRLQRGPFCHIGYDPFKEVSFQSSAVFSTEISFGLLNTACVTSEALRPIFRFANNSESRISLFVPSRPRS